MFGSGVIQNAIRISTRFDMTGDFQAFDVENDSFVGATVADESATKTGNEGDAVHSSQVGDIADD